MAEIDLLQQLLELDDPNSDSEDEKRIEPEIKKKTITKDNEDELFLVSINDFSKNLNPSTSGTQKEKSLSEIVNKKQLGIHNGDADSSDDESNRDHQNSKYNECGRDLKHQLTSRSLNSDFQRDLSTWKPKRPTLSTPVANKQKQLPFHKVESSNVYTDPFFGIRISNPLISSTVLQERMSDRAAVSMAQVSQYIKRENNHQDWVIAGVIVSKSAVKTSQKGTQFLIWTLSDLKNDLQTVAMFLFGNAYKNLWKTTVGTVLGILNPAVMDQREGSKDQATLSVDNAQRVMIFGQSKDYGICKSKKKDGQPCTAFVNKNSSEYCVYHIKQEYQKLSKRSELQANFVGGGLTALRNKVLGKNEVFYAGKSYMAIPAKKNLKLIQRDNNLLKCLNNMNKSGVKTTNGIGPAKNKTAATLEVSRAQRMKDFQLLKKLNDLRVVKDNAQDKINKALDIDKAILQAEDMLQNIDRLQKKLDNDDNVQIKNGCTEFDFLNSEPSTSTDIASPSLNNAKSPKLNNSKITEEILYNLDKIESPRTGKSSTRILPINSSKEIISMPSTSKILKDSQSTTPKLINKTTETPNSKLKDSTNLQLKENKMNTSKKGFSKENLNKSFENQAKFLENTNLNSEEFNDLANKSKFFKKLSSPKLSGNFGDTKIDLSAPIVKTTVIRIDKAKLNALKYIEKHGPIKKEEETPKKKGVKRFLESTDDLREKRQKLADNTFTSDRFKKIMALQSKHTNLLEAEDIEREEKYFKKLEIKEKMEEKMSTIFKVDCKAVRCLTCKYESFSAADKCKQERHVLKVTDAVKRFFKCAKCGNRTVSLKIIPLISCSNCGGSKWDRTTMMREKTVQIGETLSIRGLEEKYVGHVNTGGNINLLVPDS